MRVTAIAVVPLALLLISAGACQQTGSDSHPSTPPLAATPAPEPDDRAPEDGGSGWVRPAPAADPERAFMALFEALKTNELRQIEACLVSVGDCEAMSSEPERCRGVAARRDAFLRAVKQTPLPGEARLSNITLLRTIELPQDLKFSRTVRLQLGQIRFRAADGQAALGPLAAMEVEGGWRVLPGKPHPRTRRPAGRPEAAGAPSVAPRAPIPAPAPAP